MTGTTDETSSDAELPASTRQPKTRQGYTFYSDGAYTSIDAVSSLDDAATSTQDFPSERSSPSPSLGSTKDQKTHLHNLLNTFTACRTSLHSSLDPPTTFSAPNSQQDVSAISRLTATPPARQRRQWQFILLSTQPTPQKLSRLDHATILAGLATVQYILRGYLRSGTLGAHSLSSPSPFPEQRDKVGKGATWMLGAWTFSLLAACRDVGDMDSEDVSVLRGLGKVAVAAAVDGRRTAGDGGAGGTSAPADESPLKAAIVGSGPVNMDDAVSDVGLDPDGDDKMGDRDVERGDEVHGETADNESLTEGRGEDTATANAKTATPAAQEQDLTRHGSHELVESSGGIDSNEESRVQLDALLETIIYIVGYKYGQRDLLQCILA